jgi:hypothetical protein
VPFVSLTIFASFAMVRATNLRSVPWLVTASAFASAAGGAHGGGRHAGRDAPDPPAWQTAGDADTSAGPSPCPSACSRPYGGGTSRISFTAPI